MRFALSLTVLSILAVSTEPVTAAFVRRQATPAASPSPSPSSSSKCTTRLCPVSPQDGPAASNAPNGDSTYECGYQGTSGSGGAYKCTYDTHTGKYVSGNDAACPTVQGTCTTFNKRSPFPFNPARPHASRIQMTDKWVARGERMRMRKAL